MALQVFHRWCLKRSTNTEKNMKKHGPHQPQVDVEDLGPVAHKAYEAILQIICIADVYSILPYYYANSKFGTAGCTTIPFSCISFISPNERNRHSGIAGSGLSCHASEVPQFKLPKQSFQNLQNGSPVGPQNRVSVICNFNPNLVFFYILSHIQFTNTIEILSKPL